MATTHHWYIAAATGAKVDFTDPSADIDFTGDTPVASRELRIVKTDEGGSTTHPTVQLWKHAGEEITTDEITDAIADQDDAAVPTLGQAPDPVSGYQHAAITDVPAVMADLTGGESPTEAEFNALLATVRLLRTAVNALITTGEGEGSVVPS